MEEWADGPRRLHLPYTKRYWETSTYRNSYTMFIDKVLLRNGTPEVFQNDTSGSKRKTKEYIHSREE